MHAGPGLAALFVALVAVRVVAESPVVDSVSPAAAMENTTTRVRLAGSYFLGATNVSIGGVACNMTGPVAVEPCLLRLTRQDACDIAYNTTELDEFVDGMNPCDFEPQCFLASNPAVQCPFPSAVSVCALQRCRAGPPIDTCYGFTATPDYSYCGFERACFNGTCIDAKGSECPSVLECELPAANGLPTGLHNVSVTTAGGGTTVVVDGFRLFPDLAAVSLWTPTTSLATPGGLVASPGTPLHGAVVGFVGGVAPLNHTLFFEADGAPLVADGAAFPALDTQPGAPTRAVGVRFWVRFDGLSDEVLPSRATVPVTFVQRPTLYSLCPAAVLAFVNNSIVVQGENFAAGPHFRCLVDGIPVPVDVLNDRAVQCTVALDDNATTSVHALQVTNDAWTEAPAPVSLTVTGVCGILKPNSVPVGDACRCRPGFQDTGPVCVPCPDGTYQPGVGQGACITCDSTESTGGAVASTSVDACRCRDGRFRLEPGAPSCALCAEGMVCELGAVGVQEGYWRPAPDDLFVVPCPMGVEGCAGGAGAGDDLCKRGYEGPLCSVCAEGYGSLGAACVRCERAWVSILVTVLMVLALLGVTWLLVHNTTKPSEENVEFGSIVRIGMNYVQVLYLLSRLDTSWGTLTDQFFTGTEVAALTPHFLSVKCALGVDFYDTILLTMFMPVVIVSGMALLFLALFSVRRCIPARFVFHAHGPVAVTPLSATTLGRKYLTSIVIILYLVHPGIARVMLIALRCEAVPGTGTRFVRDDMRVDCESSKYAVYRALIIVYLLVYVAGAMVFVGWRMRTLRHRPGAYTRDADIEGPSYSYLSQGYNERRYLWEGYVLARKLAIVACNAFLSSIQQLYWGSVVIALSLALTMLRKPYTKVELTRLDAMTLFSLFATAAMGFVSLSVEGTSKTAVFVIIVVLFASTMGMIIAATVKRMKRPLQRIFAAIADRLFASDEKKISKIELRTKPAGAGSGAGSGARTAVQDGGVEGGVGGPRPPQLYDLDYADFDDVPL